MLRYKTEARPGLVAPYDIQPGNGAGLFLQPRSPHGAHSCMGGCALGLNNKQGLTVGVPSIICRHL